MATKIPVSCLGVEIQAHYDAGPQVIQAEAYCSDGIKVVFVIFYPEFQVFAMGGGSV